MQPPDIESTTREWLQYLWEHYCCVPEQPWTVACWERHYSGTEPPGALLRFLRELHSKPLSRKQIRQRLRYACPVCFRRMVRTSTEYCLCTRCNGRLYPDFMRTRCFLGRDVIL